MAFAGTGLTNGSNAANTNYFSYLPRKAFEGRLPNASEIITSSSHTVIIDSNQRDKVLFPNPSFYSLSLPDTYRNITSIELKGSIIPKTAYNVDTNRYIPFNVQDFITSVIIEDPGFGYIDGVYGDGAVPPNDTLATITAPGITGGTQALIQITVTNNSITNATLTNAGSGYLRGKYGQLDYNSQGFYLNSQASFVNRIPRDMSLVDRQRDAKLKLDVGNELIAEMTEGQYDFAHPNDSENGLCREVTRSLQAAIDFAIADGRLTPVVGGPQNGAEYFPYSVGDTNDGSCFLFTPNPNASENTNVSIQRGEDDGSYNQDLFLELLFGSTEIYKYSSAVTLLGYGSSTYSKFNQNLAYNRFPPMDQTSGETSALVGVWSSTPIESRNNYNLVDTPKYVILQLGASSSNYLDRIESGTPTLNTGFATLVFDANPPEVVFREPASNPTPGEGNSDFGTLLTKPGYLKAIKGQDFEAKVISFVTPVSEISSITIQMRNTNGDFYDFHGQDHLLIIQLNANDINTGYRS